MAGFFERLFGGSIKQKANTVVNKPTESTFAPSENNDGALVIQSGGHFGVYVDLDGTHQDDISLINRYREMAQMAEIDTAITNILDDAIVSEDSGKTVSLNLDNLKKPESYKKKIVDEFDNVLRLLNFNGNGHDIFRKWYIDGRLFYHVIFDENNKKKGIQEVRYVDPRKIKKVRQIFKGRDAKSGIDLVKSEQEFFIYNERGIIGAYSNLGAKINPDAIIYVTSGLTDPKKNQVLSHLHKAIKPLNNLRMVEDATVIYRLSRAPERRVFYIDVGSLPTQKAEAYLKQQQTKFRNKIVYDASTGEIRDEKKFMSMTEDFWLPRREGGKGTEIDTLQGGQNLGQIEDVDYMQNKLYHALNIPFSRWKNESSGFGIGRPTEITRDEIAFAKFIQRLRKRFSTLFIELLKKQLLLKGLVTEEEWDDVEEAIWFDFIKDNNFEEMRDMEIWRERVMTLTQIDPFVGRYFSLEWVKKNVLQMTDEEIEEMLEQIEKEKEAGLIIDPMAMQDPNNPMNQMQVPDAMGPGLNMQNNSQMDFSKYAPSTARANDTYN